MQKSELVICLLDRHGRTFASEVGVDLSGNTPSPLFRWLCAALLLSARISHDTALNAAQALADAGLTTAAQMVKSSWEDRVAVLNNAGYARYDESTARMLGETAERVQEEYGGDLRKMREKAGQDPDAQRAALKEFKGIGEVGADIFLREMQAVWPEHYPFADEKALKAAKRLGLPDTVDGLAGLVDREDFPRLLAALVRADLAGNTADDLAQKEKG